VILATILCIAGVYSLRILQHLCSPAVYVNCRQTDVATCMQERAVTLTNYKSIGDSFQLYTLVGMILNWLAHANRIPAIGVIASSVITAAVPLAELLGITLVITSLFGVLLHAQLGETVLKWSSFGRVTQAMWRNFVIGVIPSLFCGTSNWTSRSTASPS
jgi:hypothetical protein